MNDPILRLEDMTWESSPADAASPGYEAAIESGQVLWFPRLRFALLPGELRLLDPAVGDARAKNISLRADGDQLRGASPSPEDQAALRAMLLRFRGQAMALVGRLFPHYRGRAKIGNASFRPYAVEGRQRSWRQDDSRQHVDAFPSNPSRGQRLLRVFTNLNPRGEPRVWRVGEPFEDFAQRHVARIPRPLPGSAWAMHRLRVTKRRRSEYDHLMLQLHDRGKADMDWQRNSPQAAVDFAPGTTWVVFSDQVLHAVMGGQFMMEHTLYLPPAGLKQPSSAPLAVLESMLGRPLLA
jgi:hypothetical protein